MSFEKTKNYAIEDLIRKKPIKYEGNFTCISFGEDYVYLQKPILSKKNSLEVKIIKGMIAQKGIVRGTAKIVKNVSELNKVKEGDVLVSQMTFPSFIMAMRRASAFVTDEGGITCHAAIISRELNKPCVIGTKIATKVLKDGDMVEVDADRGIVKIIKNKK